MTPDDKPTPNSFEDLISSFQVLHIVSEALSQIRSGNDAAAVTPTISRIHQKFKQCEQLLDNLPGGSMTRRDQLEEIEQLRQSLQRKRLLLDRYAKHDVISRVISQRSMPGSTGDEVTFIAEQNPTLNHDARQVDRPQISTVHHSAIDNDMKMDDDFGDISGVADSLPKDDVLMGLEI